MANALARETSPYLLQHRDNPVDWLPWGDEALARARELDRPLLVSIGYSGCHWCHVMERESFEDEAIAALMNERFVCVKVDREERPDVDAIYMEAVQAMTGQGGWPLNVFLTPEQVPFYGGTYFPPQPRHGHAGLAAGASRPSPRRGRQRRDEILEQGERMAAHLAVGARIARRRRRADRRAARGRRARAARAGFDSVQGGWGGAPKFPAASVDRVPARAATSRAMALQTLRSMASGGIFDQVGGGFARYSVDATWTVPHFEKMLYDNALLARAYLHGFQRSGDRDPAAHAPRRRSTGRCARCAGPRAASTARWTPTPRASRAGSTSGRSTSCARCSTRPTPTPRSRGSAPPSAATSRARTSSSPAGPSPAPSSARGSAPRCWRRAPRACARASTTSA